MMELSSNTVFLTGLMLIILFSLSLLGKAKSMKKKKRRPPGPRGLPLVGCLHHLLTSQPQAALRDLAQKHGPVMYLRLGEVDTFVVSSAAAAQEVFQENDVSFASRPPLLASEIICYGNRDLVFAPYGDYWRAMRKLCTVKLISASKVRQLAGVRDGETMALVREIAGGGGAAVNLGLLLMSCTNSITGVAAFGSRSSSELMKEFVAAISVWLSNITGYSVSDLFPSLRFVEVATGAKRRLQRAHRQLDDVFAKIIAEGEARARRTNAAAGEEQDLLSIMLRFRDEGNFDIPISNTDIKAIVLDLFTAGTETTSSVAEWLMAELIRNPDAMRRSQEEVRQAFKNKRQAFKNKNKLRYLKAVIKETLRLYPPGPLLLRLCRETCHVAGFEVTRGSRVIVNAWAIARSPAYWDNADKFMPERFENNGSTAAEYARFDLLPFGQGRRMCPGMGFGLSTLEIMVARLLYYFDWSLPDGMRPEDLDMDMTVGASAKKTNQLHLVASPYQQAVPPMEI